MWSGHWSWKEARLDETVAERVAARFEAGCLEIALDAVDRAAGSPERIELLVHLGNLYSRLGELRKGLEVDRTLVGIRPREPVFHYNLACSLSRLGQLDPAFQALEEAFRLGYQNFDHLRGDRDLDNLRADARFRRLLEEHDPSGLGS